MNDSRSNSILKEFPLGVLRPELYMGAVAAVSAYSVRLNLSDAGTPSGSHFIGGRYGKGEVGELVIIEGQVTLLLGRVIEVKIPEHDRKSVNPPVSFPILLDAIAIIRLLGSISMDTLHVTAGVMAYPRLGDRVYAAPHKFVGMLPILMETSDHIGQSLHLSLGYADKSVDSKVQIKPEKLFGRHCAILGTTGGGKSWTIAHIVEQCLQYQSKTILLDATGEYHKFDGEGILHCHLVKAVNVAEGSVPQSLPPSSFLESDFVALFEPSGKVQGPKLRAAIRSLRLASLRPDLATNGVIQKIDREKTKIQAAERMPEISERLEDPTQEFDVLKLGAQIEQECVWPENKKAPTKWGDATADFSYCLSMITRINAILRSSSLECIFRSKERPITETIDEFRNSKKRLLCINLGGVAYEFKAREIIANVIGRHLLTKARQGEYRDNPVVLIVDEAHNFLGRHIGGEDYAARLDAFEIIAREGRKYGLNICLATQRPRDLTDGVLSQMGTMIVHRLTNDNDRELVERACGEIDRAASAFLPNLKPGEALIVGADFPVPMTVQISPPRTKPYSDGPNYQRYWGGEQNRSTD